MFEQQNQCGNTPACAGHRVCRARSRDLHSNAFTGRIPESWASLTNVKTLDLHINAAPIAVPGPVCSVHHAHLSLAGVELACPWPSSSECGGFDISTLSGVLTPWRTCTNRTLDSCFPTLSACTTLWSLSLPSEKLTGTLPPWLASFGALETRCVYVVYIPRCTAAPFFLDFVARPCRLLCRSVS